MAKTGLEVVVDFKEAELKAKQRVHRDVKSHRGWLDKTTHRPGSAALRRPRMWAVDVNSV